MNDDMTFKVIRGQGQGEEMTSVPYWEYLFMVIQKQLLHAVSILCHV